MDEWVKIGGTCTKQGNRYRISDGSNNGYVEIAEDDVKMENGVAHIRMNATAVAKEPPKTADSSPTDVNYRGKVTYCIGLLEFRCSDDKFIGPCFGAWDCS